MENVKYNNGVISIIGLFVFVIITVLVLNYFNINVRKIAQSPTGQTNINYVVDNGKSVALSAWQMYIKDKLIYIWNEIIIKIFLKSFVDNMTGKPTDFGNIAPVMQFDNSNNNQVQQNTQ